MTRIRQAMLLVGAVAWIVILSASGGCGSNNGDGPDGGYVNDSDATGSFNLPEAGGSFNSDGGIPEPCPGGGLDCYVPTGCTTSLSGTVYDPAGRNPLYNVVVFIPNDPYGTLPPIKAGTNTCNTCDVSIGNYIAATTTDSKGHFTLKGVPATSHVPLVVQTGKWRREVFLPNVPACADTPVAATNSRLPKNHQEGDLPQMALLTGGCDDLGCFMRSMGIDASEFTAPRAGGRLDVYQGVGLGGGLGGGFGGLGGGFGNGAAGATLSNGKAGDCTGPNCPLWASKKSFEYYDIVILSCECAENNQTKPPAAMQALHDWLDEGGKVFASHFHYTWFKNGPADFQNVATWLGTSTASGGGNDDIDTSFPKGQTYHDWLQNVRALNADGTIKLNSVATSVSAVNPPTTRWIYDPTDKDTKYLSFLTPIGGVTPAPAPVVEAGAPAVSHDSGTDASGDATVTDAEPEPEASVTPGDSGLETPGGPQYCGKAVFTDLHTSSGLFATVGSIPSGCSGAPLTAQQAALEYLFFDLSACVAVDTVVPPPPPPPTK
jgi:hypothetical protein